MLPAYIKIHDAIKKDIDQGIWLIGSRLPSERDLAERFAVSRMTLRQAVTLLVEEGILERRIGSGTYVASHRVQEKMRGTTSFSDTEVKELALDKTDHVIRMERIRYADNIPLVYEVASIPEKFIKRVKRNDITEHFFQTLIANGYEIGKSQQTIYAKTASDRVASYLEVAKGHAILALTQVSYFTDGKPFEYVRSQYVGDRFEFYLENK